MEVLAGEGADVEWIDPDTPAEVCTIALCTGPNAICTGPNPPLTAMTLAFSDEFEAPGRSLAVEAGDPRWTADRMQVGARAAGHRLALLGNALVLACRGPLRVPPAPCASRPRALSGVTPQVVRRHL